MSKAENINPRTCQKRKKKPRKHNISKKAEQQKHNQKVETQKNTLENARNQRKNSKRLSPCSLI